MFFKRLSRSRSNSQSYVDNYPTPHDSKTNSAAYDDKYASDDNRYQDYNPRPGSSQQPNTGAHLSNSQTGTKDMSMFSRQQPQDHYQSPPVSASGNRPMTNGYNNMSGGNVSRSLDPAAAPSSGFKQEAAPDLLTRAFNEAVRPYTSKIDEQENEIMDLKAYIQELEGHRREVHSWIDKRGLRPDVPASIAAQMDASSPDNPTHAAATLNAQLDRKITIVNFDLHRLQDDLNDSLPTPSFSACMLKFLPDIQRLATLPSGSRYAFDLLLKLGGNLNSHGGLENGDDEDLRERRSFYARLDEVMVDIVRGRFREEGDDWGVQREIKRIEKTGAYLRTWGVEPYFPQTLDVMRDGSGGRGSVGGPATGLGGHGGGTPPAYQ